MQRMPSRFLSTSLCELSVFLEVVTSDCHVVTLQHLQTVLESYFPGAYLMREEEGGGRDWCTDVECVRLSVHAFMCHCVHVYFMHTYVRIYLHMSTWVYNTGYINHPAMLSHLIGRDVCKLHKLALWICWRAGCVMLSTCVRVCVRVCMSQRGMRAAWCLYP